MFRCNFAPARPGEQQRSAVSIDKAKRELGWTPQVDLHDGLEETFVLLRRAVRAGASADVIALGYFQIGKAIPTTPWEMVLNATLVTQDRPRPARGAVAAVSWAVMFGKWVEFRRVRRAADAFIRSFDRAQSLDEVATLAKHAKASPFTRVFNARGAVPVADEAGAGGVVRAHGAAQWLAGRGVAARARRGDERGARLALAVRSVARDDRVGEPAHRAARHGARRDFRVYRHCDAGLREHLRRWRRVLERH